jgi:hypothetical protein
MTSSTWWPGRSFMVEMSIGRTYRGQTGAGGPA